MKKTIYIPYVLVFLLLAMPVSSIAGSAISKESAHSLYVKKQYAESYAQYMEVLRENPSDDAVHLGLARSALAAGKHAQAIFAYERLVQHFPEDASLHKELGLAYRKAGNEETALRHFEEAQRLDPAMTLSQTQGETEAGPAKNSLSIQGRVGAGIIYDSNYVLGPPQSDISIGNHDIRLRKDDTEDEAWGSYLKANIDTSYRLRPDGPWWLIADLGAYQKWYFGKDDALTWGRVAAGIYYAHPKFWWSARIKGEDARQDMDDCVATMGAEGTFTYLVTPFVHLMTRAEYGYLDDAVVDERSGAYIWAGEYIKILSTDKAHEFVLGGKIFHNNASERYENHGWELSAQAKYSLPLDSDIRFFASWQEKRYDGPAASWLNTDRKDEKLRLGTTLTHHINTAWSVELGYQYLDNNSNTNWSDYTQHVVNTGVIWSF
ncbi:hypothetical protein MASR1M90_11150 [Desulfovibrionales bacterium]